MDASKTGSATISNAAWFQSVNSEYLSIADNAALSTGDIDFSFSLWVNFDQLTGEATLVSKFESGVTGEYVIRYDDGTDRLQFVIGSGAAAQLVSASSLESPQTGRWYFLVAWHDASANTINIQIDDRAIDSTATVIAPADSSVEFRLGRRALGNHLDGRMNAVSFWKRTLTSAEKTWLYNSGDGRTYSAFGVSGNDGSALKTSLISHWDLDETSGQRDDSHSTNHLTDNNTVGFTDWGAILTPATGATNLVQGCALCQSPDWSRGARLGDLAKTFRR